MLPVRMSPVSQFVIKGQTHVVSAKVLVPLNKRGRNDEQLELHGWMYATI